MVVEHSFVTTLPPVQALRLASELLEKHQFVSTQERAFALDGGEWTTLEVRRGKQFVNQALSVVDLPQQVRLEWDRGRVSVAASIGVRYSKKERQELLLVITAALEALLARQAPMEEAGIQWAKLEIQLRKARRRNQVLKYGVVSLFVAVLVIVIYFNIRR